MSAAMLAVRVIERLPPIVRAAEHLAHEEGLPPGLIAARLHITQPEASAHLDLARAARRVLADALLDDSVDPIAMGHEAVARWRGCLATVRSQVAPVVRQPAPAPQPVLPVIVEPVAEARPSAPVETIEPPRPPVVARPVEPVLTAPTREIKPSPAMTKKQPPKASEPKAARVEQLAATGRRTSSSPRPKAEPAPDTKRARIIRFATEGIPPTEIAERVGVKLSHVQAEISRGRKRGIAIARFKPGPRPEADPNPNSKRARIIRFALEGIRPVQIAERVGAKLGHVQAEINKGRKRGLTIPSFKPDRKPSTHRRPMPSLPADTPPTMHAAISAMVAASPESDAVGVAVPICVELVSPPPVRRKPSGQRPQAEPDPGSPRAKIIELAIQGLLPAEIAERMGVTRSAVYSALAQERKRGAPIPRLGYKLDSYRERVLEMARQGLSPMEIARTLRTTQGTVNAYLSAARRTDPTIPTFVVVSVIAGDGSTSTGYLCLVAELRAAALVSARARGVSVTEILEWRAADEIERLRPPK